MSIDILNKYKIKAKKSLGQNFLVNEDIVESIANIEEVEGRHIIEVGPGYGALTEKLAYNHPQSLDLIELDPDMIEILKDRKQNNEFNLEGIDFNIHHIDILKYVPTYKEYSVIANIPYYITSPIIRHFLYDIENSPQSMTILMQKDVGDKIIQKKKGKSSVISLFVAKKCDVKEVLFVGKENFVPVPKVESSVLLFQLHDIYKEVDDDDFLELIKIGFAEPRKKLLKNLVKGGYDKTLLISLFESLGYDENLRGEDLQISEWIRLFNKLEELIH